MAIYVHLPFCRRRCHYCHFPIHRWPPRSDLSPRLATYGETLIRELSHHAHTHGNTAISSVYFGGGTPLLAGPSTVLNTLAGIARRFPLTEDCEVTVEANPEDLHNHTDQMLRCGGVTRISLGVQTFNDASLAFVRRNHSAAQAVQAWEKLEAFPHGRNVDLILGLPHANRRSLQTDLQTVLRWSPEHISIYMLESDLPTPLDRTRLTQPMLDDDQLAEHYELAAEQLRASGYDHYEISNFAKPGFFARHNLNIWLGQFYLGLGMGAHGRIGRSYTRNHDRLTRYLESVRRHGHGCEQREHWSRARVKSESLIGRLRTRWGTPICCLPDSASTHVNDWKTNGLARIRDHRLQLTTKGWLLSNEIFVHLLD